MLTLAFESSAKAASAALCEDGRLISEVIQCSGLTHSRTLLPMAEDLLKNAGTGMKEIDCFAVAQGPGSFTGIRIGIATVKGLAWAAEKPCVGVSTLAAMAWNGVAAGGLVCAVMDARRSEVYNALFRIEDGRPVRLKSCARWAKRPSWWGTARSWLPTFSANRDWTSACRRKTSAGRTPGAWPWRPRGRSPAPHRSFCRCISAFPRPSVSARPA